MTDQEVFDTVAKHLHAQGKPAYSEALGSCMYRGPGGTKCAVGCLIPDEVYRNEMDSVGGIHDLITRDYPGLNAALGVDAMRGRWRVDLLAALQQDHDRAERAFRFWEVVAASLRSTARDFGLSPAVLEGLV